MSELQSKLTVLLRQAGSAHGQYESTVLKGVYDQDWAIWYAAWILEHGLNDVLKTDFDADSFGKLLFSINQDHQHDSKGLSWAEFTANALERLPVTRGAER